VPQPSPKGKKERTQEANRTGAQTGKGAKPEGGPNLTVHGRKRCRKEGASAQAPERS